MRPSFSSLGVAILSAASLGTFAGCSDREAPTAPAVQAAAAQTAPAAVPSPPVSVIVRGFVTDPRGRAIPEAVIECPTAKCGDPDDAGETNDVEAQGHEHQYARTNTDGSFAVRATRPGGDGSSHFLMNANKRSYQVEWRQVDWPTDAACASAGSTCSVTVNFRLQPMDDGTLD